ncbi:DsbA family protein [Actinokineospora pegani]|uniref:DsbA family protein n=1 Tax=Actinokineospora pegani TaxID=2654637 RepID=UPI0012EAEFD9|nr:thioredoxin domain-containing protein [Actinokineospora pegani]
MPSKDRSSAAARRGLSLNVILTAVVVVVATAVIAAVLLAGRPDTAGGSTNETLRPPGSHTLSQGAGDEVTVVEFLDFQCPACASFYTNVTKKLEQDYMGRFTFVPRHFPLLSHPLAVPAARAAEAAGKQGKYAQMYHALYDEYASWALTEDGKSTSDDLARATARFEAFATAAGLDLARFRVDVAAPEVQAIVDQDIADGRELGVDSTPTFFINGEKFQPRGSTAAEVDRELRAKIDAGTTG